MIQWRPGRPRSAVISFTTWPRSIPIHDKLTSRKPGVSNRLLYLTLAILLSAILMTACDASGALEVGSTPTATLTTPQVLPTEIHAQQPSNATPLVAVTPAGPREGASAPPVEERGAFDGESAFEFLLAQMEFGPRWPGSPGHRATGDYIVEELEMAGWSVEEQLFEYQGVQGRNVIGRANVGKGPIVILGAHYDTRKIADRTPGSTQPVPGAVDGASGVAVLLELAQVLDLETIDHEVWLAFFDLEDNGSGGMPGFDWAVGAWYMADRLQEIPEAVVVVDMVGDADQQLFYEGNSDADLQASLWELAAELGYGDQFIPELRHSLIDDHIRFRSRGIVAVDIIDFDYPYWHTVEDTADKASPDSLRRVGHVLQVWLEDSLEQPD
jgi:glutaminyl-peptide cyclotransferase